MKHTRSFPNTHAAIAAFFAVGLTLAAGAALAQADEAQLPPPGQAPAAQLPATSLTVSGQGEVMVDPDRAFVSLGAMAQAEMAEQAQQQVNEVMQRAIGEIRELGIERDAIRTQRLSLHPVFTDQRQPRVVPQDQPVRPQEPRIVGYRASNTIEVRLDDLEKIGPVIDTGIEAGMNQLESVRFDVRDPTDAQREALRQASQQATRKAAGLAEALEMRLDGLVHIYEATAPVIPLRMDRAMVAAERVATPVEPGQIAVEASVTLIYRTAPAAAE